MAYSDKTRAAYNDTLNGMKEAGLFKQERFIHSTQAADIEVEFPAGAGAGKLPRAASRLGRSRPPDPSSPSVPRALSSPPLPTSLLSMPVR